MIFVCIKHHLVLLHIYNIRTEKDACSSFPGVVTRPMFTLLVILLPAALLVFCCYCWGLKSATWEFVALMKTVLPFVLYCEQEKLVTGDGFVGIFGVLGMSYISIISAAV